MALVFGNDNFSSRACRITADSTGTYNFAMEVLEVYSFSTGSGPDLQNNYIVALMYSNGKRTLETVLCGLTTAMVCADNAFLVCPLEGSTILANTLAFLA